jgi:hypothetical protein
MQEWRRAAVLCVGLLCVVALDDERGAVRAYTWQYLLPDGKAAALRRAALDALDAVGASPISPARIVSESFNTDRLVRAAARAAGQARAAFVPRSVSAIDALDGERQLLALPGGRALLEVLGFRLEWLRQRSDAPGASWSRVRGRMGCAPIRTDRWSQLPGVEYTGRLGIVLPPSSGGRLVLFVGDSLPLELDLESVDGPPPVVEREQFRAGPAPGVPADFWLEHGTPWDAPQSITRLTIDAHAARPRLLSLRLGRRAPRVLARLQHYGDSERARICAAPIGAEALFTRHAQAAIFAMEAAPFGRGWTAPAHAAGAPSVRWTSTAGVILIESARRGPVNVRLRAHAGTGGDRASRVSLRVNDFYDAGERMLGREAETYEWSIPATAWVIGTNELLLSVLGGKPSGTAFGVQRLDVTLETTER